MNLPNLLPPAQNQGPPIRPSGFRFSDINWRGVAVLVLIIVLGLVAWTVIRELGGIGSGFGATVLGWFREASINPEHRSGFTSFLYLVLIAGLIWLVLKMTRPK